MPFGLIAIDAADGSPRAAQDAPFVAALFERHKPLLGGERRSEMARGQFDRDTDWPRLAPARDWIEKHRVAADPALDSFRDTAKRRRRFDGDSSAIADKLYQDLLRSGGAQP